MTEQNDTEQGWMGVGRMTDEGAVKFGHVRKDLRAKHLATPESSPRRIRTMHSLARRVLQATSTQLFGPRPEEE